MYNCVQERLQVTTRVYFKGADFADIRDLAGLYHDLNTTNWRDKLHHGELCEAGVILTTCYSVSAVTKPSEAIIIC